MCSSRRKIKARKTWPRSSTWQPQCQKADEVPKHRAMKFILTAIYGGVRLRLRLYIPDARKQIQSSDSEAGGLTELLVESKEQVWGGSREMGV
jgi:hypothetical protein